MDNRYTATVMNNGKIIERQNGIDLENLSIFLINAIENQYHGCMGHITDNLTGAIVHQCKKAAVE